MSIDLRIRPLGRPKISQDSAIGFQRVARRYVVEGPKASKIGLDGTYDGLALKLAVGTPDEEFTDHYLVNQQLEPAKGMDKAYLTREYAEIRNTWVSESVSDTANLRTLTRRYVVLRAEHDNGYDSTSWGNHPKTLNTSTSADNFDPWDFLPKVVKQKGPQHSYTVAQLVTAAGVPGTITTFPTTPQLDGGNLPDKLGALVTNDALNWVPAAAQVDTSNPGVDVWSVSWKLPGLPSWGISGSRRGSSWKSPNWISFDTNGIGIEQSGGSGNSGGPRPSYTFTYFYVGDTPPLALIGGASALGRADPKVMMDFHFISRFGNTRMLNMNKMFSNTILVFAPNTQGKLMFPTESGGVVEVADKDALDYELTFNYDAPTGTGPYTSPVNGFPIYQGQPFIKASGKISWSYGFDQSSTATQMVGTRARPIHTWRDKRIWMVELTYA